ncbi:MULTISPECIES: hypothetical protein [unclassified Sulfuricurvum]|uniref:hypothetical protein n=1 Tax=unclassified Sulfuricurvum TaxID=2632390 RepID=UPI0002997038|nr:MULTISPECIES: hypothetical protein [unclassified Sulfuricurvum]AFV96625.1 hypothetical protein B649_01555 [Candidatus Sulfuricurvum sp. RIFRC-1]HBM36076.1 hypothetical protein [Sulfuricurvum sp.]
MNYDELCDKSILLLGKTRALSEEEFDALLKLHKITRVGSFTDDVSLIIEGRMMNPYEQVELAHLYETQNAPIVEISSVEEWLCRSIEPNRLLMSLKLSRNQERLVDFLQNPYITDELFFKLLKLYDWQNEGLFDNDTNRDVTASIIGRFYVDLDRNHNVQYAMSGLAHLIEQYGSKELISAIAELPPIANEIKHPRDRSLNGVLDAIALHSETQESILRLLLGERAALLAHREPLALEIGLLELNDEEVNRILAQNTTLSQKGALQLEAKYPNVIASKTVLREESFDRLVEQYAQDLASNPSLTPMMQQKLFSLNNNAVSGALASNSHVERRILEELFESGKFYLQLASNSSLSSDMLESLAADGDAEVLSALAANTATPIETLYQLSFDRRYERAVKTNPAFGKYIQTHNIGWF